MVVVCGDSDDDPDLTAGADNNDNTDDVKSQTREKTAFST